MADGFKLTYNPKVENSRMVREGIKGVGPGARGPKPSAPKPAAPAPAGKGFSINPLREGAIFFSSWLSENLLRSAGTPGAARMSSLGLGPTGRGSDAPVYATPLNNVNTDEKGDEDSTPTPRSSTGPKEVGGDYTVNGVTYDGKTHRPKNAPEGGYSLEENEDGTTTMVPHTSVETPTRPGDDGAGLNTGATVDLTLADANNLLARGGNKENPGRFLASGIELADVNSFLPAPMPVSANDTPTKPVDNSSGTELGGDQVAEGVVTGSEPSTIPADGADNTRSVTTPGEPETPVNYMEPQKSAQSFLAARRSAFLDLNNRGYGAIRAADAAVGRFRQGDKFFYNDGGELREVDEQTWRKGQHQAINPLDEMEEGSKFMEGWKDSKIKPTLVPSEQTDVTNPDADGGRNPQLSDFNDNNVAPTPVSQTLTGFAPPMSDDTSITGPMPAGDGGETLLNPDVPEVFATHLKRARGKRGS